MDITLIILFVLLFSAIITNVFVVLVLVKIYSLNKTLIDTNKDYVDALSSVMSFLVTQFKQSFENSQKQQEWLENNIAKLAEVDTENSQKIYDAIYQNQIFSNRLGEFLGYRPRSNIGE